jgi:mannan endo-1,4-beta-mannosidase
MTTTTPPLYMSTNHWAGGADGGSPTDYVTFSFTGTQILFYGVKDTKYGIGMASVDGGPEATIDFYGMRAGDQLLWTSPVLASGNHQFKLRASGTKNGSSTDTTITVDRVDFR